jgi:hypothetical protein
LYRFKAKNQASENERRHGRCVSTLLAINYQPSTLNRARWNKGCFKGGIEWLAHYA